MGARIYVGNLPMDIRTRDVEDLFYKYGKIRYLRPLQVAPRHRGRDAMPLKHRVDESELSPDASLADPDRWTPCLTRRAACRDIDLKTPSRPPAFCFVTFEQMRDAEEACRGRGSVPGSRASY